MVCFSKSVCHEVDLNTTTNSECRRIIKALICSPKNPKKEGNKKQRHTACEILFIAIFITNFNVYYKFRLKGQSS